MKTHKCEKDGKYIISTNSDCVVTDVETGIVLAVVLAKTQKVIQAISDSFTTSVECSVRPFVEATTDIDIIGGGEDYLPAGYKRIEYLESSGTQNILLSTPNIATSGEKWQQSVEMQFLSDSNTLVGWNTSAGFYWGLMNNLFTLGNNIGIAADGEKHEFNYICQKSKDINENTVFMTTLAVEDSIVQRNSYPNSRPTEWKFGLFAPTHNKSDYVGSLKIWRCYCESESVKYDLIPALDETGTPCMYDKVSHQPYYNSGSGDFIYPVDEYDTQTLDLDYVVYGKMTEYGIRRLYKVPAGETMSRDDYAIANGYKEIVESPMPTEGYWIHQWKETDTQLILEWIENEAPTEEL